MAPLRINALFSIVAREMNEEDKKNTYRVLREILDVRRDMGIQNDVADLFHKRQQLTAVLGDDIPNLQEVLRNVFELDTVWDYLVRKEVVDAEDSAFDNDDNDDDNEADVDEDDTEDELSDDDDDETYDGEQTIVVNKHVHKYYGPNGLVAFVSVMNTVLSVVILTKLLM